MIKIIRLSSLLAFSDKSGISSLITALNQKGLAVRKVISINTSTIYCFPKDLIKNSEALELPITPTHLVSVELMLPGQMRRKAHYLVEEEKPAKKRTRKKTVRKSS